MQATYALSNCLTHHTGSVCLSETWISPCSLSFSRSKRRINGLKRYDAVRAAYSSLDSRSVSCCAIEILGRALIAQTFVTASPGAVFSPQQGVVTPVDTVVRATTGVTIGSQGLKKFYPSVTRSPRFFRRVTEPWRLRYT